MGWYTHKIIYFFKHPFKHRKTLLGVLLIINFFAVSLLAFMYLTGRNGWWLAGKIPDGIRKPAKVIAQGISDLRCLSSQLKSANLPEYHLEISPKDYQDLLANLPRSINDFFSDDNKKSKDATFYFQGQKYKVKVRFRGDGSGHWFWQKKSWRIDFEDSEKFMGMKSVNLHVPDTRGIFMEYLDNYRARKLGLVTPNDGWAVLYVNGEKHGIYYQTEQWGEEFLERSQLSPDTNLYADKLPPSTQDPFDIYGPLPEVADKWKKFTSSRVEQKDSYADLYQFFDILYGDDKTFYSQIWNIVDEENFYNWYIHARISASLRQDSMHNARLYFDKEIGKFRFLPTDVLTSPEGQDYFLVAFQHIIDRLLQRPEFLEKTEKMLWNYVGNEENIEDDLAFYDKAYQDLYPAFAQDRFDRWTCHSLENYVQVLREQIKSNFTFLKENIKHSDINSVISYTAENGSTGSKKSMIIVEASLKSYAPLIFNKMVLSVENSLPNTNLKLYEDVDGDGNFDGQDKYLTSFIKGDSVSSTVAQLKEKIYPSLVALARSQYENVGNFSFIAKNIYETKTVTKRYFIIGDVPSRDTFKVKLFFSNTITNEEEKVDNEFFADRTIFDDFYKKSFTFEEVLQHYPFFYRAGDKILGITSGEHLINENVVVPKDMKVQIQPGAKLLFTPGVAFLSYSPVFARGTVSSPIEFRSLNDKSWGNFVVVQASDVSIFDYTVFDNGSPSRVNGGYYSGMLALHYSPVIIYHSSFSRAQGDDSLNVKYASSTLRFNTFKNNSADAIDIDYGKGIIGDNYFEGNGNDSIDISGTFSIIENNYITNSGDKCISVGEKSGPIIFNNILNGCKIGVEAKDGSTPTIVNNVIVNNSIGVNAYLKKDLYVDGGKIKIFNSIIWNNEKQIANDEFSSVDVEYSNVQGGWHGQNNFQIDPQFNSINENDYMLSITGEKVLATKGDVKILQDLFSLSTSSAPIGLFRKF